MIPSYRDDLSLAVTAIFLMMLGYWMPADRIEGIRSALTKVYTFIAISTVTVIEVNDLFHSLDNTSDMLYVICNMVNMVLIALKLITVLSHITDFHNLIIYFQRKFLHSNYDLYEKAAVDTCKRNCSICVCSFSFFALVTSMNYILTAFVANIGQTASDRILPLPLYLDNESTTPSFEILFIIQTMFMLQTGICYFCFDNVLTILCLHASCQFRILKHRLRSLNNIKNEEKNNGNSSENAYAAFRNILQYHQSLITFCDKLEVVFTEFALGQVVLFSLLICLDGYNIFMADTYLTRRLTFIFHICGVSIQLLMFTYSCDCLMHDSADVASSVYDAPWIHLEMDKHGRMMRKDMMLVVARAREPCYLTASGFTRISLETYTKILSTAMSYFTLIRGTTTADE